MWCINNPILPISTIPLNFIIVAKASIREVVMSGPIVESAVGRPKTEDRRQFPKAVRRLPITEIFFGLPTSDIRLSYLRPQNLFTMTLQKWIPLAAVVAVLTASCNNTDKQTDGEENKEAKTAQLKEDNIKYNEDGSDSLVLDGYVVYDENIKGKRPVVLVVHEWWGLSDYEKRRARELAQLGYLAMAVDMYGNGRKGNNPEEAGKLAMPFYMDPQMTKERFESALNVIKKNENADTTRIAAIGYCFGGGILLNTAKLGENINAVVSFHGSLMGVTPQKGLTKANILVCHGAADSFVPQADVDNFRKQLDSVGVAYTFKTYDSATHAFTNPEATRKGKDFNIPIAYNAAADTASWNDMKVFLNTVFK
jgi:dienelactone hydrolase